MIANRFFYFCSQACAATFSEDDYRSSPPPATPLEAPRESSTPNAPALPSSAELDPPGEEEAGPPREPKPVTERASDDGTSQAASPLPKPSTPPRSSRVPDETLLRGSVIASGISLILLLALESTFTAFIRVGASLVGTLLLATVTWRSSERRVLPILELLGPPFAGALTSLVLLATHDGSASSAVTLAGGLSLAAAVTALVMRRRRRPVAARLDRIRKGLSHPASRVQAGQLREVAPSELGPGEEIVIHAGETVPADVTVTSGRAEVNPWLGANVVRAVEPGDTLYAGSRLCSGQLKATVRWTGYDRHWERLVTDPARRVDAWAPLARAARSATRRGAIAIAIVAASAGLLLDKEPGVVLLWVLSLVGLVSSPAAQALASTRAMVTVLDLLDRGVVAKSAAVVDMAGRISMAVFCARGTLLLGEPELSHLESFSNLDEREVLSLVVGAEQYGRHPVAVAVSRAARARGIRPDAVRTPVTLPGLGVTAVTSDGKHLVVGSRALMLKERISIARVEERIAEIEASGRTVLLVAVAQRLVGMVALQDGLRPGARAAVQHLLDAGIEPVLLSGDARQTCEALGKAIDVDHIRPEILPNERGTEIERLKSGGATVAVVGRSPADDIALSQASVSIALPSTGSRTTEFDVELASDEVQTAAMALFHASRGRKQSAAGLVALGAGALISALLVLAASAPVGVVPLIAVMTLLVADALMFAPWKRT